MTDKSLHQLPTAQTLDDSAVMAGEQLVNGEWKTLGFPKALLKGLDGVSSIATITNTTPGAIPAVGQNVTYEVSSSAGFIADQIVSVGAAATLKVVGTPTPTTIILQNVNATPGAVAAASKILPSGEKGSSGANGNTISFGTTAPSGTGNLNDMYINSNTGAVYRWT